MNIFPKCLISRILWPRFCQWIARFPLKVHFPPKRAVTHQRISETRAGRVEKIAKFLTSETRSKLATSALGTLGVRPARLAVRR